MHFGNRLGLWPEFLYWLPSPHILPRPSCFHSHTIRQSNCERILHAVVMPVAGSSIKTLESPIPVICPDSIVNGGFANPTEYHQGTLHLRYFAKSVAATLTSTLSPVP